MEARFLYVGEDRSMKKEQYIDRRPKTMKAKPTDNFNKLRNSNL